jgi:acetyltransferase EpsM
VSDKEVVLIGYSGHGFVVADTVLENGFAIKGYSDIVECSANPFNLGYLGFEKDQDFSGWKDDNQYVLGIGDNKLRQTIAQLIESKNQIISSVIHSSASISKSASIGNGTFINRNVSLNALAIIGKHAILNTGCVVEHECVLADAVHIGPAAVLAGAVTVGERTFVGANSVIKQGITIGKDVIIGAGSVVIANVPDNEIWAGNPAKRIK